MAKFVALMVKERTEDSFKEMIINVDCIISVVKFWKNPSLANISVRRGIISTYIVDKSYEEMKAILCV